MEVAAGLVGEALKELPGQAEPERAGHVLLPLSLADALVGERIQPPPDQAGPPAEVNYAPRQTLIHRYMHLAGEGLRGSKPLP